MKGHNRVEAGTRPVVDPLGDPEYAGGAVQAIIDSLGELHVGIRSLNGNLARGAVPRVVVGGQSVRMSNVAGRIAGYAFRETSGVTAATIRLLDGFDQNGDAIIPINLAANDSVRDWFMPVGISYGSGLYVQVLSGTIEGAVFLAPWPNQAR